MLSVQVTVDRGSGCAPDGIRTASGPDPAHVLQRLDRLLSWVEYMERNALARAAYYDEEPGRLTLLRATGHLLPTRRTCNRLLVPDPEQGAT